MNIASSAGAHAPAATFLCGLLGSGIGGSRSPFMHETEAYALGLPLVYRILDGAVMGYGEADLSRILAMLGHMGFAGVNVTHPFKQAVVPLMDRLSDAARALGRSIRWCGGRMGCWATTPTGPGIARISSTGWATSPAIRSP
jgi:shikimate dehydrogenase